jgi:hypothetical protein
VLDKGQYRPAKALFAYDYGSRHTIGFEPNTFVDITSERPAAAEWLGRFMALMRNQKYDTKAPPCSRNWQSVQPGQRAAATSAPLR